MRSRNAEVLQQKIEALAFGNSQKERNYIDHNDDDYNNKNVDDNHNN